MFPNLRLHADPAWAQVHILHGIYLSTLFREPTRGFPETRLCRWKSLQAVSNGS